MHSLQQRLFLVEAIPQLNRLLYLLLAVAEQVLVAELLEAEQVLVAELLAVEQALVAELLAAEQVQLLFQKKLAQYIRLMFLLQVLKKFQ